MLSLIDWYNDKYHEINDDKYHDDKNIMINIILWHQEMYPKLTF